MNLFQDFILNGEGHGEVGEALGGVRFDPGIMRPYIENGEKVVTVNTGRTRYNAQGEVEPIYEKVRIGDLMANGINPPVFNATSLRKEEWIKLDETIIKAARPRLRAWSDLAASSTYSLNGMGTLVLESETMNDPGEALVDMDVLAEGRNDQPKWQLEGVPLPITHSDFFFSQRRLAVSRNRGTPVNTIMAEAAGRRVAEMVEKTVIGVETGLTYGTQTTYGRASTVYGYINFPNRMTKTNLTVPTGSNPEATVSDVLAMREQMYANNMYGPFIIYTSSDWDLYLDNDYARLGGDNASMTLRDRLRKIEGIQDIKRLDYLTAANSHAFTMIMVQMDSETAQAIDGLGLTTIQWESKGGMQVNFKVMCIWVPRLQAKFDGTSGILHARTA